MMQNACKALAVVAMLGLTGCDQIFKNPSERNLQIAETKNSEGDYAGAVAMYEASLDGTPKTANVHYKLALVYDKLCQPISALHHFERYLDLLPDGPHAREAKEFMKEDQLKLNTVQGDGATVPQQEAARLKNDNLALRKQVIDLRTQLEEAAARTRAMIKASGVKNGLKPEQIQKDLVPGVRTYMVEEGDTLASISRKFYKNPGRWKDIQDANFNAQEGTAKIKPGMTLMIP